MEEEDSFIYFSSFQQGSLILCYQIREWMLGANGQGCSIHSVLGVTQVHCDVSMHRAKWLAMYARLHTYSYAQLEGHA